MELFSKIVGNPSKIVVFVLISFFSSHHAVGQESRESPAIHTDTDSPVLDQPPSGEDSASAEQSQQLEELLNQLEDYGLAFGDDFVLTAFLDTLGEALGQRDLDHAAVYNFARAANEILNSIDSGGDQDIQKFIDDIDPILARLIETSYTDLVHQNANLSGQLVSRLGPILEDLENIKEEYTASAAEDFKQEIQILQNRYVHSKRFSAGLGISSSYLPSLNYNGSTGLDFSEFQTEITGGRTTFEYDNEFSNSRFQSLVVSFKIPYFTLDLSTPSYEEKEEFVSSVGQLDLDASDRDVRFRTTVESTLQFEYDATVKLDLQPLLYSALDSLGVPDGQIAYGLGIGASGFKISDLISTDVRFDQGGTNSFDTLTTDRTLEITQSRSFVSPYAVLFYDFLLSDEMQLGASYRYYFGEPESTAGVDVSGSSLNINYIWYPSSRNSWKIWDWDLWKN